MTGSLKYRFAFFCACVMSLFSRAHAQGLDAWHFANPLPVSDPVTALTWDGNRFVAFGSGGWVLTSPDGSSWDHRFEPLAVFPMRSMVWTGQQYVAVGPYSTILTSPDAITWTRQAVPVAPAYEFWQVLWNDSKQQFVVVGDSGIVLTSADGSDWILRASETVHELRGIAWDGNRYVAVGGAGTVISSPDGINWTDHTPTSRPINTATLLTGIAWDAGTFVVSSYGDPHNFVLPDPGARILTSPDPDDASKWTVRFIGAPPGPAFAHVVWDGSVFVTVGGPGVLLTSADGITWNKRNPGVSQDILAVAGGNNTLVATVLDDSIITSDLSAADWTTVSQNVAQFSPEDFTGAAWNGSEFAVVSDAGGFYTSPDGLAWTAQGAPFPIIPAGIAWGNGRYVVAGDDSLYASADGVTWNQVSGSETAGVQFDRVRWVKDRFLAVGSYTPPPPPIFGRLPRGVMFASFDGVQWAPAGDFPDVTLTGDGVHDVLWGGGQFVAVGSSRSGFGSGPTPIFTSPDGTTWSRYTVNELPGPVLRGVAWNGSVYVAVGTPGLGFDPRVGAISTDGIHWSYIFFPPDPVIEDQLTSIVWTGKYFVALGLQGTQVASPDGYAWSTRYIGSFNSFEAVISNGQRCIAVGIPDTILTNDPLCNNDPIFANSFE